MTAYHFTEIGCDAVGCDRMFGDAGHAHHVRQRATEVGWKVGSKGDFCPDHKTRAARLAAATVPAGTPIAG